MRATLCMFLVCLAAWPARAEDRHTLIVAASCAACHGTSGNSVGGTPVLAALDCTHFIAQMQAFRSGTRPATVMHRHARGLSEAEIEALATYFSSQPRTAAIALPSGASGHAAP